MFREHGTFTIEVLSNNIILTDATGPWNQETLKRYFSEIMAYVDMFKGQPWFSIDIHRNETLLSPEALHVVRKILQWKKSTNFQSQTIIYKEHFASTITQEQAQQLFHIYEIPIYFANDLDSAFNQLRQVS